MSLKGFDTLDALLEQILADISELENVDRVIEIEGDFNDGQHLYSSDEHFVLLAKENGYSTFNEFKTMLGDRGFELVPRANCQLLGTDYHIGFSRQELETTRIVGNGGSVSLVNTFNKAEFRDVFKSCTIENYSHVDLRGTFRGSNIAMLELYKVGISNASGMLIDSDIEILTYNECWLAPEYSRPQGLEVVASSLLYKMIGKNPKNLTEINLIRCESDFIAEILLEIETLSNLIGLDYVTIVIKD
jgi:hypothetical protein